MLFVQNIQINGKTFNLMRSINTIINYFLDLKELKKIELIHKEKLFLIGLFIKVCLVCGSYPLLHELFIPFIENSLTYISFDPWNSFLDNSGNINSFPYGLTMLLAYSPLPFLGNLFDNYIADLNFLELGFRISSLFYDYLLLIILLIISKFESKNILLICYWLSPIMIYTTYLHGQVDILPITFLFGSICAISSKKFSLSGVLIGLAISSKLSMLIALPFILIYIQRRRGLGKEFFSFVISLFITLFIFLFPYVFSKGYSLMVFQTREFGRLYSVFVLYGDQLKLYLVPTIYILSLYLVWRLKRITKDLFIIGTGLGFFSIITFLPPAPGWSIWVLPFLAYYQVKSKRDIFTVGLIYNFIVVINTIFFSSGAFITFNNFYFGIDFNNIDENLKNLIFTFQQAFCLLLAIRMYIYGIRGNSFYSFSEFPTLISVMGNNSNRVSSFITSINNLIYKRNLSLITTSDYISTNDYNNQKNVIKTKKEILNKIPYFSNHVSQGLNYLNRLIDKNAKDYLIVNNDLSLKTYSYNKKFDFFININKGHINNKFFQSNCSENNKFDINFDFKLINNNSNKKIYALIIYLPFGYLHPELLRYFISISSLNIDTDISEDKNWVKMIIEGEPSSDDVAHIAKSVIPYIDDLPIKEDAFAKGYEGIMQIILLANISSGFANLKKR